MLTIINERLSWTIVDQGFFEEKKLHANVVNDKFCYLNLHAATQTDALQLLTLQTVTLHLLTQTDALQLQESFRAYNYPFCIRSAVWVSLIPLNMKRV